MMVPLWSAVGDQWVMGQWVTVRRVLAMSFPRFCLELMSVTDYTARELVDCWETLPIVRHGKSARGTSSSQSAVGDSRRGR